MAAAFELLTASIQHSLWRMGWTELRPIQADAIQAILAGNSDVIVSAATASGKTEAAFLPIISDLAQQPAASLGAVYVSPLKALINDQFRRLEELCEYAELPVYRWHGDVSRTAKEQLLSAPAGILLITPESLESLFINRSAAIPRLFRELRYVVIDELHALVGRERGTHLRSLLHRLEAEIGHNFRMVALSATLGDWFESYADWIRPGNPNAVTPIVDESHLRTIRLKIYGYTLDDPPRKNDCEEEAEGIPECARTVDEMLSAFGGRKNLIFANRKDQVERFADALNERCKSAGRPAEFLVHHGSLSKQIREETERLMRGDQPFTTFCSSTLELGIDIGNVAAVGQIGAPWSVSSLIQRLGRSGRRDGEASEIRIFLEEFSLDKTTDLVERLYPELLQAIALTELMLQKWLEPPHTSQRDLSTFVQQIFSVLAQTGGTRAKELFTRLVERGAFAYVSEADFLEILRSLVKHDLLEQVTEGDLVLGLAGERVVKSREFYSAFASTKEYVVIHDARPIGSLPAVDPPPPGDHLLLAGRRWRVVEVDLHREEIQVIPSRGRKPSRFHGAGGDLHDKVRVTMRDLVLGDKPILYLNSTANEWLAQARANADRAELAKNPWHCISQNQSYVFAWRGTRIQRTLLLLAQAVGLTAVDRDIAVEFRCSAELAMKELRVLVSNPIQVDDLMSFVPYKEQRKYDMYLSDELLSRCYAQDALDLDGAIGCLNDLLN